jgi:lipocalin-like protein
MILVLGATLSACSGPSAVSATDDVDTAAVSTVPAVDLDRYTGVWHEIAKIPNRFQNQCARGTTAEYTLRDDGRLTVLNRCLKADGKASEAEGQLRQLPGLATLLGGLLGDRPGRSLRLGDHRHARQEIRLGAGPHAHLGG